jgi:alkanesulfonate monooxygenase SsuD/methylene tetrahydromethanopterin reductase-like flavin-dependent oxidoreductase (luciferase family)
MWSGKRGARFGGTFYELNGAHAGPAPAHPIGIWLGVLGPRMLELTGRLADGWVPSASYAPPEKLAAMHERIDAGAATAGRPPASIRRLYNLFGTIADGPGGGFLQGPVDQWVDELVMLATEYGMDTFVFGAARTTVEQIELFAREVTPRVRERVAQARTAGAT